MPRKTNTNINGRAYYRVTATVGKKEDGSAVRKQFYGENKRDAEAKRDEYMQGIKKGLSVDYDKLTFGTVFEEWLEHVHKPKLAISSAQRYEYDYRLRIKPAPFCRMKLVEIKAIDVQRFYNGLLAADVSVNSVRNAHKLLATFFRYALKSDMIIKNPLIAVELPKERKIQNKKMFLTRDDVSKIVNDAKHNQDSRIFVFLIFSGLRIGEALALRYIDVDAENISVNKSVKHLKIDGVFQPLVSATKTVGSTRKVPLFQELLPLLKAHKVYETEKHRRLGLTFSEKNIIFSSPIGDYLEPSTLRRRWERICNRLNIEKTTIHAMRHSFCSLLAQNGVNLKTASELMGHNDTKTTMRIYTHVQSEDKIMGIATLSNAFNTSFNT
ncbi:MAG: site-specific integrase [Defluviitaleaceae bacterium]|nr:site-specific integrase [Defluviitaleaceae bacterium]